MKRKPKPDTRPDWRDPNLPVYGKSGRAIDYYLQEEVAKMRLATSREPFWRDDPTYNMRKKSK